MMDVKLFLLNICIWTALIVLNKLIQSDIHSYVRNVDNEFEIQRNSLEIHGFIWYIHKKILIFSVLKFLKRNSQNIDQTKPVLMFAHAQSKFGYQIDKFNWIFYQKKLVGTDIKITLTLFFFNFENQQRFKNPILDIEIWIASGFCQAKKCESERNVW